MIFCTVCTQHIFTVPCRWIPDFVFLLFPSFLLCSECLLFSQVCLIHSCVHIIQFSPSAVDNFVVLWISTLLLLIFSAGDVFCFLFFVLVQYIIFSFSTNSFAHVKLYFYTFNSQHLLKTIFLLQKSQERHLLALIWLFYQIYSTTWQQLLFPDGISRHFFTQIME